MDTRHNSGIFKLRQVAARLALGAMWNLHAGVLRAPLKLARATANCRVSPHTIYMRQTLQNRAGVIRDTAR